MVLVMRAYRFLWLLSLLILVYGCGNPFPPRTLVERLRVLGIKSEPADTDLQGSVELSALVVDKTHLTDPYSASWIVCSPGGDYNTSAAACWSSGYYSLPAGACSPDSGVCSTQLSMPQLIDWLAPQLSSLGIDITTITSNISQVDIWIGFTVTIGDIEVQAIKRLPVHLPGDTTPPNNNPVLTGLNVNGASAGSDPIQLPAGSKITLKPLVDEYSRDTFTPSGESPRQEDFVFSWFSTNGEFDFSRTISSHDNLDNGLDENKWSIPKTLPSDQSADGFLWLVVRDGRFGTDWKTFPTQFQSGS